jgi:hypothetical protein
VSASIEELLAEMRRSPAGVRFSDACRVADHFFGEPTQKGSSHRVWRMPWPGNPRVNMQDDKGKAKAYQVRQLLEAVERRLGQLKVAAEAPATATATANQDVPHGRKTKKRRR